MKKNIYLFYGDEDYLIDERVRSIKKSVVGDGTAVSYQSLSGAELSVDQLVNAISTVDLFSPQKMIVVPADELFAKKKKKDTEVSEDESPAVTPADRSLEMLLSVLEQCPDTVTVVFYGESVDMRKKFGKWLKANARLEEFKGFKPWEEEKVEMWVQDRFRAYGYKAQPAAVGLLVEMSGTQLRLLEQEVRKIITYKGADKTVTRSDVEAVASSGELSSLAFVDLLRRRETAKALVMLQKLSKEEEPIMLHGLLVSQFRLFLQVRQAMEAGQPMEALGPKLGKHPFYLKKLAEDLRVFSAKKLKELFYQLQRMDQGMKTGEMEPWLVIEEFVLSV